MHYHTQASHHSRVPALLHPAASQKLSTRLDAPVQQQHPKNANTTGTKLRVVGESPTSVCMRVRWSPRGELPTCEDRLMPGKSDSDSAVVAAQRADARVSNTVQGDALKPGRRWAVWRCMVGVLTVLGVPERQARGCLSAARRMTRCLRRVHKAQAGQTTQPAGRGQTIQTTGAEQTTKPAGQGCGSSRHQTPLATTAPPSIGRLTPNSGRLSRKQTQESPNMLTSSYKCQPRTCRASVLAAGAAEPCFTADLQSQSPEPCKNQLPTSTAALPPEPQVTGQPQHPVVLKRGLLAAMVLCS